MLLGLPGQGCEAPPPARVGAMVGYALGDFSVCRIGFGAMENSAALVTGASKGIGKEIARQLAATAPRPARPGLQNCVAR